eukprot:scaffold12.g8128.t1
MRARDAGGAGGGLERISGLIYEETRGVLKVFLENVVRDAVTYTEHARRKTVTAFDVVYALKRQGRTLYGFGAPAPAMPPCPAPSPQGTKVLVLDVGTGEVVGRGSVAYGVDSGAPGVAEQHPSLWVEACRDACAAALQGLDAGRVAGIGVSGQQHGLVALGAGGEVLRRRDALARWGLGLQELNRGLCYGAIRAARELSRAYGVLLVAAFTATKLLWLKRNEPETFRQLATVLLPHDYINFWLTGRRCMEASDASGTGLLDVERRRWDLQRMRLIDPDLPACFPEVMGPTDKGEFWSAVGTVLPEVAALLGLPPGVVVSPGGGDNACSALGAGAVTPKTWVLSLGTSGTLFGPSDSPVLDPTGAICPFCDATGKYLPLLCTLNCAGVVDEWRKALGLSHEELTELAAKEPPGCAGVTLLPYLAGERTPNWPHATGTLLGLRPGLLRPGLLYRAALEGCTFSLLAGLRRMEAHGVRPAELLVVGGGSQNRLWRRIIADAFQLPLHFPAEPETAALGAALQAAAVCTGEPVAEYIMQHHATSSPPPLEEESVAPSHELAGAYASAFERFQHWGAVLFGGGSTEVRLSGRASGRAGGRPAGGWIAHPFRAMHTKRRCRAVCAVAEALSGCAQRPSPIATTMHAGTPPDTIQQELGKHRAALKEAQGGASGFNLDAYATETPLSTPAFVGAGRAPGVSWAAPVPEEGEEATGSEGRLKALLHYDNPPVTYLVVIVGTVVLAAGHFILSGVHNVTLLTAVCYALLAHLALNFFRGLVSREWQANARWGGSAFARRLADRAVDAVGALAAAHDAALAAEDPAVALRVAGALWATAVLGRWLSIWSVVTLAFLLVFTLPAAYAKHQTAVQATYANLSSSIKARWDGLLSRKQKLLVLAALLLVLLVHSAWSTRLCALLLGALAIRCQLKPAEVQRIQQIAEPYTQTVRKQTRRVSMAATDFALRSLGGKAHFG